MVEIFLPTPTATPALLRVHVAGAVARPGVYGLRPGDRVEDALAAAGGALTTGDPHALNLAAPLRDGQKVYVPFREEAASPSPQTERKVAINSATVKELEALPFIGEAKAREIVSYREAHGPFQRVEDLLLVPGIGPGTLERIRDLITLD